jgi:hypothetical protein
MPAMLRMNDKCRKIAYAILGKPANLKKKSSKDSRIDKRLLFEETSRVR